VQPFKQPPPYPEESTKICNRTLDSLDTLKTYTFEKFFSGYFRNAKMSDIKRENLVHFLSWVLHAKHVNDLTDAEKVILYEHEESICKRYKLKLEPGYNKDVQHISMTIEDIPYLHRPLLIYILSGLYEAVGAIYFRSAGFHKLNHRGVEYWHKPVRSTFISSKSPIVLFHGITSGWLSYFQLSKQLSQDREIFMLDLDGIKMMSLVFEMPTPELYCEIVQQILENHKITEKVHIVGHSFGTFTAAWIARYCPHIVSHLTLLDPVSLLLGLPEVAYSFLYRKPTKMMEYLIYYVAATEITIATMLRRNFWWYKNMLWLEDLPTHISVVIGLAGNDEVTAPHSVREYALTIQKQRQEMKLQQQQELKGIALLGAEMTENQRIGDIEVLFWDDYSHGTCCACNDAILEIAKAVQRVEYQAKTI